MEQISDKDIEHCALPNVSLAKQHSRNGESASPDTAKSASSGTMEKYEIQGEEIPTLPDGSRNQLKIASSLSHLMTHYPKNPHCIACSRAKIRASPSFSTPSEKAKHYKAFGDHVTADFKVMFQDKKSWGIDGQRCVLIIYDSATEFIAAYPMTENSTEQVVAAYLDFMGNQKIKYIYCDGGPELVAACKSLGIRCDTSTPYSPKRNAIAEEKVKRVLYSSRTLLEHSGLDAWYWPYSVKAACTGLNVVGGTRSAYFLHHGCEFKGKFISLRCLTDYLPTSHLAGKVLAYSLKALPGIFLGRHVYSG